MKFKTTILIILFVIFGFSQLNAQSTSAKKEFSEPGDYVFVLKIAANSEITLGVRDTEGIDNIGSTSDTLALDQFFSLLGDEGTKDKKKRKINPIIIVQADPRLKYGTIIDFLVHIRKRSKSVIKLEISKSLDDPFAIIPEEPNDKPAGPIRPNPNTLVVSLTPDNKITLNAEERGELSDLSPLKKILSEIFELREKNGVFREGTNEVEKTLFIKAYRSLQFSEVIQLIIAVKEAGATPVGLQVDDLEW